MQIEKNIPVPAARTPSDERVAHGTYSSLVKQMQVGDSFSLDATNEHYADTKKRAAVFASAKHHGFKITSRKRLEDGLWKVRFWRIS